MASRSIQFGLPALHILREMSPLPTWKTLLDEANATGGPYDALRRKYVASLGRLTKRNVIVYYSGWLQKPGIPGLSPSTFAITDSDKNGFMAAVHGFDRTKGLDLILHTPGGEIAATESLVDYLRAMFGTDIRAIVPQLAMSCGTMIALSCKSVVMGKHSSLGPIDPQIAGIPAHGIIEEFLTAQREIQQNQLAVAVWQPIIAKYSPTLVGECQKAIQWANMIVREWLISGMFEGDGDAQAKADRIVLELADHALTLSHGRHISLAKARDLGINVVELEQDQKLQDAVLSVHHSCIQTLTATPALKLIQNHTGTAYISALGTMTVQNPQN